MPAVENSESLELLERAPASVDPPEAPTSAPEDVPLLPALPAVCLAASHRLLWRWAADAWHCPLCGTSSQPKPGDWGQNQDGRPA